MGPEGSRSKTMLIFPPGLLFIDPKTPNGAGKRGKTVEQKQIGELLEKLSACLTERETIRRMDKDNEDMIDRIRRQINENHPLLRTVFGIAGPVEVTPRGKRRYLAPKRPRSYWMPKILNQFRGVRVPVHVGVMVETFKTEGWTRSATNNRIILLKRDGYLLQDEQGRYLLAPKGMNELQAKTVAKAS